MKTGLWDCITEDGIRQMVAEGKSDTEMANAMNCSASAIQRRRTKLGLKPTNPKHRAKTIGPLQTITHTIDDIYCRPWI